MRPRVSAYRQVISIAIRAAIKIADGAGAAVILCAAMLALAAVSGNLENAEATTNPAPIVHLLATPITGVIEGQSVTLLTTVNQIPGVGVGFAYGYTWTIYDGATALLSGAQSNVAVTGGFAYVTAPLTAGLHSFQAVYSSDLSGYLAGTSNTVDIYVQTRQEATQNIINSVNKLLLQGIFNGGQDNSLVIHLQRAINLISAGKPAAAIVSLNSFISEVNNLLSSGVLSPAQATPLTSAAESLIAVLS